MVQASDDRSESVSNFHCLVREPVENVVTVLEDSPDTAAAEDAYLIVGDTAMEDAATEDPYESQPLQSFLESTVSICIHSTATHNQTSNHDNAAHVPHSRKSGTTDYGLAPAVCP